MTRTSRGRRAAALLLASATPLLLAAGCRIPGTGVVEVGEPATGARPVLVVHLVKDGALYPVARSEGVTSFDVTTAVNLAFRGPDPAEELGGVTTALPAPQSGRRSRVTVDGDRVLVELARQDRLPQLGVDQLVCTVAAARALETPAPAPAELTVVDGSGRRTVQATEADCPDEADPAPEPVDGIGFVGGAGGGQPPPADLESVFPE
ncbi:hypothetical protein AB0P17_38620 [Streptomyces sp. NPDC088124]|uniref:hypothetical protein n=1 Tax=Streptomyces sp. NPDC088124 TaxID=3154654 RepID=UPI0034362925